MRRKKFDLTAAGSHLVFILLSISTIVPLFLLLMISLSDHNAVLTSGGYAFIPEKWSLSGYKYLLESGRIIGKSYLVTILITVVGTIGATTVTTMAGYVLSRRSYCFHRPFGIFIFFTMIFNAGLIPTYIVETKYYGLQDNLLVCILPYLVNCWNAILLRTFYQDLPYEVIESAIMDGAGEMTIFLKIATPMVKSGIVTIALMTMLSFWNQWQPSQIYFTKADMQTLQLYLFRMIQNSQLLLEEARQSGVVIEEIPTEVVKYSAAILVMGPTLAMFPFFQKYFVRGANTGAVKG